MGTAAATVPLAVVVVLLMSVLSWFESGTGVFDRNTGKPVKVGVLVKVRNVLAEALLSAGAGLLYKGITAAKVRSVVRCVALRSVASCITIIIIMILRSRS